MSVFGTDVYPHMPIICQHTARSHERRMHVFGSQRVIVVNVVEVEMVACWPIFGFWESKVHKTGRMPALNANELPCKI